MYVSNKVSNNKEINKIDKYYSTLINLEQK